MILWRKYLFVNKKLSGKWSFETILMVIKIFYFKNRGFGAKNGGKIF